MSEHHLSVKTDLPLIVMSSNQGRLGDSEDKENLNSDNPRTPTCILPSSMVIVCSTLQVPATDASQVLFTTVSCPQEMGPRALTLPKSKNRAGSE